MATLGLTLGSKQLPTPDRDQITKAAWFNLNILMFHFVPPWKCFLMFHFPATVQVFFDAIFFH